MLAAGVGADKSDFLINFDLNFLRIFVKSSLITKLNLRIFIG